MKVRRNDQRPARDSMKRCQCCNASQERDDVIQAVDQEGPSLDLLIQQGDKIIHSVDKKVHLLDKKIQGLDFFIKQSDQGKQDFVILSA